MTLTAEETMNVNTMTLSPVSWMEVKILACGQQEHRDGAKLAGVPVLEVGACLDQLAKDYHGNVGCLAVPEHLLGHQAGLSDGKHQASVDGREEEGEHSVATIPEHQESNQ